MAMFEQTQSAFASAVIQCRCRQSPKKTGFSGGSLLVLLVLDPDKFRERKGRFSASVHNQKGQ